MVRLRVLCLCIAVMLLAGLLLPCPPAAMSYTLAESSSAMQQTQEEPAGGNENGSVQEPENSIEPEQTDTPAPTGTPQEPSPTPAIVPASEESPTPTVAPETEPEATPGPEDASNGYAIILADESPVFMKASKDSETLAFLSKEDVVYISDRFFRDADNPGYDWVHCHFDSERGVMDGYMRLRQVRFLTEEETQAFLLPFDSEKDYADHEGHPLALLDCAFPSETPEPDAGATEPPPADEATPSPTPENSPVPEETPEPSLEPTIEPTIEPTLEPTASPTAEPTIEPTIEPTLEPSPSYAPAASVTLDISEFEIIAGTQRTLHATVEPAGAADPAVLWISSDESVLIVDAAGTVTAVSAGSAVITAAASKTDGIAAQCAVTVYPPITSLTVTGPARIQIGKAYALSALDNEAPIAGALITWSSSDETVATVDASGSVTGVMAGNAVITATIQGSLEWKFDFPLEIIRATVVIMTDSNKQFSIAVSENNNGLKQEPGIAARSFSAFSFMRLLLKTDGTMPALDEFNPDLIVGNEDNRFMIQFTTVEETEAAFEMLKNAPYIKYVAPDSIMSIVEQGKAQSTYTYHSWGASAMHADTANEILAATTGGVVYVAVVDSGISPHSFLSEKHWVNYDYVDNDTDPNDENGHGTHVAGTIVDLTQALNVRVVAMRVLDENGDGLLSNITDAIYVAADIGCDVINLSLGGEYTTYGYNAFYDAISYANRHGAVVVCAAGNDASNTVFYIPACINLSGCVVTTSVDGSLRSSDFSNYGYSVDVTAPGENISSCSNTGGFTTKSGTSMAAPHISAACAMIKLRYPSFSPSQIESYLYNLCTDLGPAGFDWEYGFGIPNLTSLAPPLMPDLAAMSITNNTADVTAGRQVYLDTGISNNGNASSGAFAVKWEVNGAQAGYGVHNSIPAHTTEMNGNSQLYWTPTSPGYYTISFKVDCDNAVNEENESNNTASLTVFVNPAPLPPPQSITLSHTALTIGAGQGASVLAANVLPAGSNTSVTWTSTNSGVATVNNAGYLYGVNPGTAVMRASTVNGLYRECVVNVVKPGKGVLAISMRSSASVDEGKTVKLTAGLSPRSAVNKTVLWSSSNPAVASVDSKGTVFGSSPGTALIYAEASSGLRVHCVVTVNSLAVSQVLISKTALRVDEGKSAKLTASVLPKNARYKTITWSSSNPAVATVSAKGAVSCIAPGTAVITATAINGVSAQCVLTVNSLAVSQVNLSKTYLEVDEGKSAALSASVLPKNARFKTIAWTTSDPSIATVSSKGKITTYKPGTVQITATAHNGVTSSCTLVVRSLAVTSIALNKAALTLKPKASYTLKAALLPKNARYKAVTWVSSNPAIATVSTSGKVKAISPGTVSITAIAHNGLSASCTVTVP